MQLTSVDALVPVLTYPLPISGRAVQDADVQHRRAPLLSTACCAAQHDAQTVRQHIKATEHGPAAYLMANHDLRWEVVRHVPSRDAVPYDNLIILERQRAGCELANVLAWARGAAWPASWHRALVV